MKLFTLVCLSLTLLVFDCSSSKSSQTKTEKPKLEKNMSELMSYENTVDGIAYKFKAEMKKAGNHNGINYEKDFVEVEYELKNTTEKNYIVFNKGHFGSNSHTVYVEPKKDGTVEISQKAFEEPKDRNCPDRFVAISPLASLLKSKENMVKKIQVELPLETRTPFDDCEPKPELPKDIKEVKFCIGVMEADSKQVKLSDDGTLQGMTSMKGQKLLCSDSVSLTK